MFPTTVQDPWAVTGKVRKVEMRKQAVEIPRLPG
jgi:hypothetical protein